MNRIDQTFQQLKRDGQSALIPFITVGDPDVATSIRIIQAMEEAGADLIELGVPYSDPLADGPVIQRASQRALEHQITVIDCIKAAGESRKSGVNLPFILFTYYNPLLQLGFETLFNLLRENDISGLIIPDLPVEESSVIAKYTSEYNIHLIPLVAPTSNERIERIVNSASGFIYCVSSLGVTGERADFHQEVEKFIQNVKEATSLPVAVGFGISNREQVERFSELCDGVIVGSAIVRKIEEVLPELTNHEAERQDAGLLKIRDFVRQLKL
ncbi:tryptophan synthase subunit alpha [Paenibacillus swuensis]|uniref:Tryptophan synthase alpha chain n=1 Tax=Paenibacillus swuensis TaxID=1178515 RepID=A0A172TLP8_9BACL|nr:tryptophan synthase subunit alpha [Paenibacillus swuensis]ANE47961.1 tryptophan synthase subunit alpha [Paenibacillus swuensis]